MRNLIGALVLVVGTLVAGTASAQMLHQVDSPAPRAPLYARVLTAPARLVTAASELRSKVCAWRAELTGRPACDDRN